MHLTKKFGKDQVLPKSAMKSKRMSKKRTEVLERVKTSLIE